MYDGFETSEPGPEVKDGRGLNTCTSVLLSPAPSLTPLPWKSLRAEGEGRRERIPAREKQRDVAVVVPACVARLMGTESTASAGGGESPGSGERGARHRMAGGRAKQRRTHPNLWTT